MHKTVALREESKIFRGKQLTQDDWLGQSEPDPKDVWRKTLTISLWCQIFLHQSGHIKSQKSANTTLQNKAIKTS